MMVQAIARSIQDPDDGDVDSAIRMAPEPACLAAATGRLPERVLHPPSE
jgi:hypothetical protein